VPWPYPDDGVKDNVLEHLLPTQGNNHWAWSFGLVGFQFADSTTNAYLLSTATLVAPLTTPRSSLNRKNTRLFAGSRLIGPSAVANTAKVGEPPSTISTISTITGSPVGAEGLMHSDVVGSVWHRLSVNGNVELPVSALTVMVAEAPTLIEAAVKKPLLFISSITPLLLVVAASAIRSGTARNGRL